MAVKPITNPRLPLSVTSNRAEQVTMKNYTNRSSNDSQSYVPGYDSKNYAVTLKDIDTSVLKHIKEVMRLRVSENGESLKVPVFWGNQERWKAVRKNNGVLRDRNGALMTPLVMLTRTNITKNTDIPQSHKHDLKREYMSVVRTSKWSKDNQYGRFSVQQGLLPSTESIVTGPAEFVDISYDFIVWTSYMEQMNVINEQFIQQNNTYWGSAENYKFYCDIDGWADASEMSQNSERFIKTTFSATVKGYLLSEIFSSIVTDKVFQAKKVISPRKIVFGMESDATNEQIGRKFGVSKKTDIDGNQTGMTTRDSFFDLD